MHNVLILIVKGLAGGTLVVVFAVIAQALSPKRFAGLFSAAPSVALAGLTVTILDKGPYAAHENGTGMLAGSAGMVAYAAVVVPLLRRMKPGRAAAAAIAAWVAVAGVVAIPVLV